MIHDWLFQRIFIMILLKPWRHRNVLLINRKKISMLFHSLATFLQSSIDNKIPMHFLEFDGLLKSIQPSFCYSLHQTYI